MHIEPISFSDLLAVQQLNLRNLPENYTMQYYIHHSVHNPSLNFICKDSNKTIAYILGKEDFNNEYIGHLASICVDYEYRKKGIASKLIDRLIAYFIKRREETKQSMYRVTLKVRASNDVAIQLYKKKGFVVEEVEDNYYNDGEAAKNMVLTIGGKACEFNK